MDRYRGLKRLEILLLAAVLAVGMPGMARAEEGSAAAVTETGSGTGSAAAATETGSGTGGAGGTPGTGNGGAADSAPGAGSPGGNGMPGTGSTSGTESGAGSAPETGSGSGSGGTSGPTEGTPDPPEDEGDDQAPGAANLRIDGYEIYAAGGSKDTLDTLRKGRQAKILVHVKTMGIKTRDVGKNNITVAKLNDSFKISGNPKVRVTSDKEDDLEFTVTFSRLTYLGRGNSLKFRTSFKKAGIPSEIQEVNIYEAEESAPRENGDSGSTNGQPVIKVRRISPQAPVAPGDNFTLGLDLENTSSDADIEDMVVSVSPGSGVFISDDTNSRIVSRLDSKKTASVKLNMIAGTGISGPTQVIDLELKYNYYSGGNLVSGTASQKVLIPVKGGSSSGQPVIQVGRSSIGRTVNAGEAFQLMVTLRNTSTDKDIRNLAATFEPNDQISLLEETDTRQLGELKAGQSMEVPVRLQAGAELSSAASQLLGMTLKFDYDSDKGTVQGTYSEKVVIPTNGQAKGPGTPTPNVIVTSYTYGEKVTAGQVFDLEMEFRNTSSATAVENVVMSLETGEGISINSSSNTFYIPKLGPGESRQEKVKVQALFQSKLQSPKITIACKYEYVDKRERKQSSSNETIAIPVYQPDRFQVREPSFTDVIRQGEEATVSIPYVNKGRGQVYNVEARLEGEIDALARDLTLGNFESGKSGTIDFVVTPKKKGPFQGQVTVTYEDETADMKTVQVPVKFDVQEAAPETGENQGDMGMETSGGYKGRGPWLLAAAGVCVLAVVGIIRTKKRKRKHDQSRPQEWDELEDMDGEDGFLLEQGEESLLEQEEESPLEQEEESPLEKREEHSKETGEEEA